MKKWISALTVILMVLFSVSPVYADGDRVYVIDEQNLISQTYMDPLNEKGEQIYQDSGMIVSCLLGVHDDNISLIDYVESKYKEYYGDADGIMLGLDEDQWWIYSSGKASQYIDEATEDRLWGIFIDNQYYDEAISDYMDAAAELFTGEQIQNTPVIPDTRLKPLLVDDGDLLTSYEESQLLELLESLSEKQYADIAVVTVNSLEGKDAQAFADDYYDYNGYGYGEDYSGIMLVVCLPTRDYALTTYGEARDLLTDRALDRIEDAFVSKLSDGDYYGAFRAYANTTDQMMDEERSPAPTSVPLVWVPVCLLIGFSISGVIATAKKSKLKSVARQYEANNYYNRQSFRLRRKNDRYINSTMSRVPLHTDDGPSRGSGSGHTFHTSSSGRIHGGRSGKF